MLEQVRCLVWDLDNTLWSGTLLESDACRLRPGVRGVLSELNERGILLSIASTNDSSAALTLLARKGILNHFLHPQIGWMNKICSIRVIADRLGLPLDALAFIDDEPFEREQVRRMLPSVRTYAAEQCRSLLGLPEFRPAIVTEETRTRRVKYVQALARERAGDESGMTHGEFLAFCDTRLTLRSATPDDVPRVLELMRRTHQLNSTGVVLRPAEIEERLGHPSYRIYVAELRDRFVDYGRIGVAVCHQGPDVWELESFLLSCRVLSRGIAGCFLSWLQHEAVRDGAREFHGRYRPSKRNHRMEQLYRLAGFKPSGVPRDGTILYSRPPEARLPTPAWLTVNGGS
jgi:FkbH-like protein